MTEKSRGYCLGGKLPRGLAIVNLVVLYIIITFNVVINLFTVPKIAPPISYHLKHFLLFPFGFRLREL